MAGGSIILLLFIAIVIVMLKTFYDSGKKALSIFPDIKTVQVKYRDKTALGYSTKSWKTKVGGASRAVEIVVTDKELWLRSFLLFAGITKQHDLLHRIPLSKIIKIKEANGQITLDFKSDKGESKQVVLNTKDKNEFLRSLGK
ncbi:MAG: hypothetical protein C0490_15470 [Marivirga sp.]|nr:hypothetical protein [Marivirga sp.]